MLRKLPVLTCFFIWTAAAGQQYPFVHYTPKDGLLSNRVRSIYQDSKGKLYFSTLGGLSLYDGARFVNYTSENGLSNDIVNCIMEMGEDSVWIVPNVHKIQCLVKGKLKPVALSDPPPIIDNLVRDEKGTLYAASEQGLYVYQQKKFVKLPFIDVDGRDVSAYIDNIIPVGNCLLVVRDNALLNIEERYVLYLYDKESKKIIAQSKKETIFTAAKAPDGRIWVSTEKNILSLDTLELKKGKIVLNELPGIYHKIKIKGFNLIFFDQEDNCWLTDRISVLKKVGKDGAAISFTTSSGLSTPDINQVFQDKEGIIWIATFSAGVDKLVNSNFSFTSDPFGLSAVNNISYSADKNQLLLYSYNKGKAVEIAENNGFRYYELQNPNEISELIETSKGLFGFSGNNIYKMMPSGNRLYPQPIFSDTIDNQLTAPVVDRYGNLILCGKYYLTAVVDGKTISRKKINYFADRAALDTNGNVWIATRDNELVLFETNPSDPANYLVQKINFKKELSEVLPRSLTIDRKNILWIGSRSNGLFAFRLENGILTQQFHLNTASGLSDNFVSYLTVDMHNNIWACSPSGLDKISIKDGVPVIENITKQNNIYQSVLKVVIDKNNTAWALLSNGLIKITPENRMATGYAPKLMITSIKAGKDTIAEEAGASLSHSQNSLSFYFSAPTYLDEKQVRYSYQLLGSGNDEWTEPSNNASISFIDLQPRDYTLNVKVSFPSGRYPQQMIQYKFSIMPPWWQTWWLRTITGLLIIGLLIIVIRFYYRRKLEKEKTVLEKQQAIEKERTRIATDMHDDLGAGLSRIKFLSETIGIKKQQQLPIEEDISKIREYSHDMIDKMGEIVWALNEKNDSLSDLLSYTRAYAVEYLSLHGISCTFEIPEEFPAGYISGEFRRSIYLTIKEALHNVVKHAQATGVKIKIKIDHSLAVEIKDNGTGFDKNTIRSFSNGLSNMKSRITGIGGDFEIINEKGTRIKIKVPLSV